MTMAKKKTTIARISSNDGGTEIKPLTDSEVDDLVKEKKSDRFLRYFKNEKDFTITVYKVGDRGKTSMCEVYENRVPDPINDIRRVWGGGQYKLYAHNFAEPPELIDSCVLNLEPVPAGSAGAPAPHDLRKELLDDIVKMKTLFGENGNSEKVMLMLLQMQGEHSKEINKLISDINKSSMENQIRMEQRFSDMLKEMTKQKSSISEITEIMSLVDEIRGGGEKDSSMFEKVINNPLVQNVAAGLIQNPATPGTLPKKEIAPPVDVYALIPDDFKNKVTRENYAKAVEKIATNIGGDTNKAGEIVERILKERGL